MYDQIIKHLQRGESVAMRPRGNSMTPRIKSGQRIVISPITSPPKVGDVVLAKVHGNHYIHLVSAIRQQGGRTMWQISNNHGRVNGWTVHVFGVVTKIGED